MYFMLYICRFSPYVPDDSFMGCYENYAVFAVSSFQYITLVICFAKGAPYRKDIFSNSTFRNVTYVILFDLN